ncbi:MAG: DUF4295 domain-containing protein [Bacteroidetes bacterium]|jgi:hypothetical protein|nr:DUF4295 domain-containing protein [Bacteroidota bacterium]
MAKKQSFGDKVLKQKADAKKMAKMVISEKKPNGQYSFRHKMVNVNDVAAELSAAKLR